MIILRGRLADQGSQVSTWTKSPSTVFNMVNVYVWMIHIRVNMELIQTVRIHIRVTMELIQTVSGTVEVKMSIQQLF